MKEKKQFLLIVVVIVIVFVGVLYLIITKDKSSDSKKYGVLTPVSENENLDADGILIEDNCAMDETDILYIIDTTPIDNIFPIGINVQNELIDYFSQTPYVNSNISTPVTIVDGTVYKNNFNGGFYCTVGSSDKYFKVDYSYESNAFTITSGYTYEPGDIIESTYEKPIYTFHDDANIINLEYFSEEAFFRLPKLIYSYMIDNGYPDTKEITVNKDSFSYIYPEAQFTCSIKEYPEVVLHVSYYTDTNNVKYEIR